MAKPRIEVIRKTAKQPAKKQMPRVPQQTSLFGGILAAAGVGPGQLRKLRGFHPRNLRRPVRPNRPARGLLQEPQLMPKGQLKQFRKQEH